MYWEWLDLINTINFYIHRDKDVKQLLYNDTIILKGLQMQSKQNYIIENILNSTGILVSLDLIDEAKKSIDKIDREQQSLHERFGSDE